MVAPHENQYSKSAKRIGVTDGHKAGRKMVHMESQSAGKGSKPRPSVYTKAFRSNLDRVDFSKKPKLNIKTTEELRKEKRASLKAAEKELDRIFKKR